ANLTSTNYDNGCADATPDVCGSANDSGTSPSGVAKVELTIQRASDSQYWNGSTWQPAPAWNLASGTTSWSYGFSPAADDVYTVVSRATDKATNVETPGAGISFTIDDLAPTSAASVPDYETSPGFNVSYSANDGGSFPSGLATVDLYAKGPTDSSFHKVDTDSGAGIDNSFSYAASQGDGNYAFYTVATDKAGNAESKSVADDSTLLDTQNPNSAASVPDYETSASFNASYSASDPVKSGSVGPASGLATVDLYAKGPTDSSFHKVDTDSGAGIDNSFSYAASQGDGNYAFYTVATDKAGNAESKSVADDSTLLDTQNPN